MTNNNQMTTQTKRDISVDTSVWTFKMSSDILTHKTY